MNKVIQILQDNTYCEFVESYWFYCVTLGRLWLIQLNKYCQFPIISNLQLKQRNRLILIYFLADNSVVLRGLKFSWNEPFVPSVWPLDKFQCCLLWHRVYGHPNWADVLAVNRIIGLIVMPRRWNFGRWLLYQHMLMVKHTAQGDKKNGILFECVCQFPRLDTFRVLSFPKEILKSKII